MGRSSKRSVELGQQLKAGHAGALAKVTQAFTVCRGNLTWAADMLGVPWRTMQHWRRKLPAVQQALDKSRTLAVILDDGEPVPSVDP